MSDEKLDLILTVVSDIKVKVDNLETRFDGLETEFKDFKKQVVEAFSNVQNRFTVLEKQMVAIGIEVKNEIKAEIEAIGKNLDHLEEDIIFNRTDTLDNRRKIREVEMRLTKLENHVGITN